MPLSENILVPVCKNVGSRPYSSFGQESCKPYRTVGLYGGPRLPNLEQFFIYEISLVGQSNGLLSRERWFESIISYQLE